MKVRQFNRDFFEAVGIATVQFGRIDQLCTHLLVQLRLGAGITADAAVKEIVSVLKYSFARKVSEIFSLVDPETPILGDEYSSISDLQVRLERAIVIRNLMVHGLWADCSTEEGYRCLMIDRKGRSIPHLIGVEAIKKEAIVAGEVFDTLFQSLKHAGLVPGKIPVPDV